MPFFGYAPFILKHDPSRLLYKALANFSKITDPVNGGFLGLSLPVVSINSYEAVKEALLNQDLDGRIYNEQLNLFYRERPGNPFSYT